MDDYSQKIQKISDDPTDMVGDNVDDKSLQAKSKIQKLEIFSKISSKNDAIQLDDKNKLLEKTNETNEENTCRVCCNLFGLWNNVPLYIDEIESILHEEIVYFEQKIIKHNQTRKEKFDALITTIENTIK